MPALLCFPLSAGVLNLGFLLVPILVRYSGIGTGPEMHDATPGLQLANLQTYNFTRWVLVQMQMQMQMQYVLLADLHYCMLLSPSFPNSNGTVVREALCFSHRRRGRLHWR